MKRYQRNEEIPIYGEGGDWIKNAINPKHKGYCTPMTKSTCTPHRKAFAKRAKAHFKEEGGFSIDGYKPYSPDRYKKFNVIPSNNITMEGVQFPILGEADTGERKVMMPGGNYSFPSARYVKETPIKKYQTAGIIDPYAKDRQAAIPTGNVQNDAFSTQAIQQSGLFFEPQGQFTSALDFEQEKTLPPIENLPYTQHRSGPNFNDMLNAIPGVGAVLNGIATQVDNKRKTNDMMAKLNNPLSSLPYDTNTNDYYTKGAPTYQDGGGVEEDGFDSFLWDDDSGADAPAVEETPTETVDEEAPVEEDGVVEYVDPNTLFDDEDAPATVSDTVSDTINLGESLNFDSGGVDEGTKGRIQKIIDNYSGRKSPLDAEDFLKVSRDTGVPVDLMLAQAIHESNIGTKGRATRTKNIFNVGNTDEGGEEHHDNWLSGAYRYANLIKNEYATNPEDISAEEIIGRNFVRPKGGRYATAGDYTNKVANLVSKIRKELY